MIITQFATIEPKWYPLSAVDGRRPDVPRPWNPGQNLKGQNLVKRKNNLLTVWNRLISFGFFLVLVHHSHYLLDHFSLLKSFSNCQNTLKIKISLFLGYIWIGCSFPLSVIKWVISLGNCLYSILSISALHFEKCF